ncbi:carbohydrate kinase [Nocardia panacis]|uniref:Carbohydrate kinase n=1 Tax=Nocardia panacis TaxID=2340916 RepID=A0A3A4JUN2_9NOCA|nr:carbohydrate kinase [Nocardia panacis]
MVAVAGEALIDMVPTGRADEFQAAPGGSPANVAVGLARSGVPTRMLARLGADLLGRRLRRHLSGNGVDLRYAVGASEPSSLALVDLAPDGSADYDFRLDGACDWQWTDAELADALDGDVRALHTGSLALILPPGADVLQRLVVRARPHATISYDPNCRPLLEDRADVHSRIETMLPVTDIIKASAEDLHWLYPGRPIQDVLRDWNSRGPALTIVTLGAAGAVALGSPEHGPIQRPGRTVTVVDTVGAGDAFTSGLLAHLHRRDLLGASRRDALRASTSDEIADLLDDAILVAALTCARRGANPPTRTEILAAPAHQGPPRQ